MENIKVDAKGMDCPFPLVKFKKAIDAAEPGQMVEIEFTCPDTTVSIPGFCQDRGIEIVEFERGDGMWTIVAHK